MRSHNEPGGAGQFEGFRRPNYTPVPDELFDRLLPLLSGAELRALLYIIRRTFGFKKDRDAISFNQFIRGISARDGRLLDGGCGIRDRTTLSRALRGLEEKKIIVAYRGVDARGENETTLYALRFADSECTEQTRAGVVGISYYRGRQIPPVLVGPSYPQETVTQDTAEQVTEQQHTAGQLVVALADLGVTQKVARELVRRYSKERIEAQIDMLPYRSAKDPPAVLVQAIREDWAPPADYETLEQREARAEAEREREAEREEQLRSERVLRETWRERAIEQYGIDQETLDLWKRVQSLLIRLIGPSTYRQLFAEALMAVLKNGDLRILVPHQWQKSQIGPEHRESISQAIVMATGQLMHFEVTPFA